MIISLLQQRISICLSCDRLLNSIPGQELLALDSMDKLDAVENLILNPQTPKEAKILWNYATYFDRKNPVLISLATAIGLDSNQVDQLFTEGAKINAYGELNLRRN